MAGPAAPESLPQRLSAVREQLARLEEHLDPPALERQVQQLEEQMQDPDFWGDQDKAAKVNAEYSRTKRKLDLYRSLEGDVELAELSADDPDLVGEVDEQLKGIEQHLAELEEERLFAGKYDAGDALVTVNAGAGGTDAQDWAEMVLRMQMRWAEKRGFKVELLEVSPGEEYRKSTRLNSSHANISYAV